MSQANDFFATFPTVGAFSRKYVLIEAPKSEEEARSVVNEAFGNRWAFLYTREEFQGQPERWDLQKLCTFRLNQNGYWRAHID